MNVTISLGDAGQVASGLGMLVVAWATWRTYRRAVVIDHKAAGLQIQAQATHDLVNGLSEGRLAAGKAASLAEGITEGRLRNLEQP